MDPMVGLKENFVDSNIRELMENGDRMDRKMRRRITRLYVRYILMEYIKKFESRTWWPMSSITLLESFHTSFQQ